MNFSDELDPGFTMPPAMEDYASRFFHLKASMKTNQGLAELANWLDLPLNVSLAKIYELHVKETEENLKKLMLEFNQSGFNEEENMKIQDSNESWENNDGANRIEKNFVLAPEVPADFFMDDDEEELKNQKNLEKLIRGQNIVPLEDDEEEEDEIKNRKLAKKAKILSKNRSQNQINIVSTNNNEDENEYNEDDKEESQQNQSQLQNSQISFDIPVVAENPNAFFSDDENDGEVDEKLNQLKIQMKEDEEEEKEEKPKVKKSKILPKVKQPQIIIKPQSPKPSVSKPPEISHIHSLEQNSSKEFHNEEISKTEQEESKLTTTIPNKLHEDFLSNDKLDIQMPSTNNNSFTQSKTQEIKVEENQQDLMPSLEKKNDKVDISYSIENNIPKATVSETSSEVKGATEHITIENSLENPIQDDHPTDISDQTIIIPTLNNDNFFSDDEDDENKEIDIKLEEKEEEPIKELKKSKILPKAPKLNEQIESVHSTKIESNESNNQTQNAIETPLFDSLDKKENIETNQQLNSNSLSSKLDFDVPTFNDANFFSDDDNNNDLSNPLNQKPNIFDNSNIEGIKQDDKTNEISFSEFENNPFFNKPHDDLKEENETFGGFFDSISDNDKTEQSKNENQSPEVSFSSVPNSEKSDSIKIENQSLKGFFDSNPSFEKNDDQSKKNEKVLDGFFETISTEKPKSENEITSNADRIDLEPQQIKEFLPKSEESQASNNDIKIPDIGQINLTSNMNDSDDFFSSSKSVPKSIADLPPPPPIDFSSSFLSEKKPLKQDSNDNKPSTQNASFDFDFASIIEKDRQHQQKIKEQYEMQQQSQANNQQQYEQPRPTSQYSEYASFGDYQSFNEAPKEKRHHKSRSGGSHRHRSSSRRNKKVEEEPQQEETTQPANEGSGDYLSFD